MSEANSPEQTVLFSDLGLSDAILKALSDVGYESPSPIQAASIPSLLEGRDILGQAQTGTGKTAAFALPLLNNVDVKAKNPQILVLAPTRELAIQVAEAFQKYASHMKGFHVLPIYGGQEYGSQIRALKRGVQVVVGTPGRVMDHMRKGTLKLDDLQALVLDEADEMLRMGFIDDVEWVMEQTPSNRQVALFSATMPKEIHRIAKTYLNDPVEVKIDKKTRTADTIRQRCWWVSGLHKMDALTRLFEFEKMEASIVFVRTKTSTVDIAERLSARGHACEALNGDMSQQHRERTVEKLKSGKLDILVATDVVARGLDVERVSHVINFDIPYDTESYVHRIGRTGRAGREGDAILFVAPRERRMLQSIERAIGKPIENMKMPSAKEINEVRIDKFKAQINDIAHKEDLSFYTELLSKFMDEGDLEPMQIAAALAHMTQGEEGLLLKEQPKKERQRDDFRSDREDRGDRKRKRDRFEAPLSFDAEPLKEFPDVPMKRYRIDVGYQDGVKPGNIVGAIANEADIESQYIGHIEIRDDFTVVDLPDEMPKDVMSHLKKVRVCGQQLDIGLLKDKGDGPSKNGGRRRGGKPGGRSGGKDGFKGKGGPRNGRKDRGGKEGRKDRMDSGDRPIKKRPAKKKKD